MAGQFGTVMTNVTSSGSFGLTMLSPLGGDDGAAAARAATKMLRAMLKCIVTFF